MPAFTSLPGLMLTRLMLGGAALSGMVYAAYRLSNSAAPLLSLAGFVLWVAVMAMGVAALRRCPRPALALAAIVGAAILARLVFFCLVRDGYSAGDTGNNLALASHVLSGQGLQFYDRFINADAYALYPPVLPLFIAGLMRVGLDTPIIFVVVNVIFDVLSLLLIVRIGRTSGMPMAGLMAAWCFAMWPSFVALSAAIQKETLGNLELLAILSLLWDMHRSPRIAWSKAAALGLVCGLLALTQPAMALFPCIAALFLFHRRGRAYFLQLGVRVAPFALLVLVPWWVRNWLVFGSFVPLTTTLGYSLWVANHAGATGMWVAPPSHLAYGGEIATTARLGQTALDWIVQHPGEWMHITTTKIVKALSREDYFPFDLAPGVPFGIDRVQAIRQFVAQSAYTGLIAYCGVQASLLRASPLLRPLGLTFAAACLSLLLSAIPFEFAERHRYILVLLLFLLAGALLAAPTRSASEMKRPTIG